MHPFNLLIWRPPEFSAVCFAVSLQSSVSNEHSMKTLTSSVLVFILMFLLISIKSCHWHKVQHFLSLKFDKTYFLQFWIKNSKKLDFTITLLNKRITNTTDVKLLGFTINETLSWKCHIHHILSRLSTCLLCYEDCHTHYGRRNFKNYLFFVRTVENNLWHDFGVEYTAQ